MTWEEFRELDPDLDWIEELDDSSLSELLDTGTLSVRVGNDSYVIVLSAEKEVM